MKKFLKKEYLLIAFIFIIILSTIIIKPLGDLDEIWNYNVARNVAEGKILYKEVSTITTPLIPFISSIFLKIIANQLVVIRVLAAILGTAILYIIFKIMRNLTKEINISMIITIIIGWLFREIYCLDYNYMILFLCLSILYLELKQFKKKKYKSFWLGILAGLAICTKQSIGMLIAIATAFYPIMEIEKKQDFKSIIKEIGKRILGITIPCIILVIYLIFTNSMQDFINYAIQGIATFDNHIPYKKLLKNEAVEVSILARIIPIIIFTAIIASIITKIITIKKKEIKNETKEKFKNLQKLTIYSLPILIVIYPIADKIHFLIGITITIITAIYCIWIVGELIYKKLSYQKKKFIYKTITLFIWLIMAAIITKQGAANILTIINDYHNNELNQKIAHYKYINIPDYLKDRIEKIDKYIKEKKEQGNKVYILDAESAVYMIPLNKYTKDYDIFLKGNLGKDGEDGQIERIIKEADDNTIYLIKKDEHSQNWQSPLKVITYVKENLKKVGETEIYDAYMQKNKTREI